jgi:hypothetical protein
MGRVRLLDGTEVRFPLTGCVAAAREKLYGDNARYMVASLYVENLRGEIERRALADERCLSALRAWRQCMRGAGHPVQDPGSAAGRRFGGRPWRSRSRSPTRRARGVPG